MQKNKGFTLVELLVTVAILSIVLTGVTALMVTGSRSFAKGNADAEMQRQAQLAVDQIEDMIIDTNGGVDYVVTADAKELVLFNQSTETGTPAYTKEIVRWEEATQEIRYTKWNVIYDNDTKVYVEDGMPIYDNQLLAAAVQDFNVDITDTIEEYGADGEIITIVQSVQILAEYIADSGAVAYATTPVITLRNRMMLAGNPRTIFEEPPYVEPKQLAVDVTTMWHRYLAIPRWHHEVMFRGDVTAAGFAPDESLTYKWEADVPWVTFPGGDSNPNECVAWIELNDWNANIGVTFNVKLTVTGPGADPAYDSDSFTLYENDSDTHQERGQDDSRAYYSINHDVNGDLYAYEILILDGNKQPYPDQEKLKQFIVIKEDKGGFGFNVLAGMDPTREYFVQVTAKCDREYIENGEIKHEYNEVVRTLYIPAVRIAHVSPTCAWIDWATVYGAGFTGDGIRYAVEGFVKETWRNTNPYDVTLVPEQCFVQNLPENAELKLIIPVKMSQTDDISSNIFRLPFQLDVVDKTTGASLSAEAKKDIVVESISVKIQMTQEGYSDVVGIIPVTFTH